MPHHIFFATATQDILWVFNAFRLNRAEGSYFCILFQIIILKIEVKASKTLEISVDIAHIQTPTGT